MGNTDYITASSYIRTQENRLISKSKLESLMGMENISEVLGALSSGTDYRFTHINKLQQADDILRKECKRIYDLVENIAPHKQVVEILKCKYDYALIKRVLKSYYIGKDIKELSSEVSSYSAKEIYQAMMNPDISPMDQNMKETILQAMKYLNQQDIQGHDLFLDRKMYEEMSRISKELSCDLITEQVRMTIDFYNVKALLRSRDMDLGKEILERALAKGGSIPIDAILSQYSVPLSAVSTSFSYKYLGKQVKEGLEDYAVTKNFSKLENLLEDMLLNHIKKAKYVSFGPEVLYAYILAKEHEISQVRIIITCKWKGISNTILRRKIGETYV
ncbi:MAG TPA: V-type ATPase subunit [Candidatus Merdenecus merdavium]|nr:V-type ATPase subunit [Candidatus Merdenecus merdavium]